MGRAMTVAMLDRDAPISWPEDPDLRLQFAIRHMVDAFNAGDSESAYLWSLVGRLVNTGASEGTTI